MEPKRLPGEAIEDWEILVKVGEPVKIGFSPDDSLVFDTATESLVTGARVCPPLL